jgi:hypothetical protein
MANVGNTKPVIKIITSKTACTIVRLGTTFANWCDRCDYKCIIDWPDVEFQYTNDAMLYAIALTKSEQFKGCEIVMEIKK